MRINPYRFAGTALAVAMTFVGCSRFNPPDCTTSSGDPKSIVVASTAFGESRVLAEIYAQALEANGFKVNRTSASATGRATPPLSGTVRSR